MSRLGPDPLRHDDPPPAFARIAASRRSIGELLLDQAVVAGVGNVLRADDLHSCRVHPARKGSTMLPEELHCLWDELERLMERASDEGRIISVDTAPGVDRAEIDECDGRYVYKQDRYRNCGRPVRSWCLGTRTAYACEQCQRAA